MQLPPQRRVNCRPNAESRLPMLAPVLVEGMSLDELEEMAQRCNPALAQAAARVEAARGEWLQAGLYPNPRGGYLASEINDEHQAGQQGAFFGQEIVTAGKLRRSRDAAAQAVRQAECALAAGRCRVLSDVRRAFYDALVAQRSVELTGQLVRVGQEGERAAESLLRAKEVSRVDVLQARIEADSARILAEKARNRLAGRLAEPGGRRWRRRHAAGPAVGRDSRRPGPVDVGRGDPSRALR